MWGQIIGSAAGQMGTSAIDYLVNRQAVKDAQQYQTDMSNTAHQREVGDLKAAGLNPILSAGGSGASTPSSPGLTTSNLQGALASGLNTGAQLAQAKAQVQHTKAQASQASVQAELDRDALEYYKKHPGSHAAVQSGLLAKKAGIRPELGVMFGQSSAGSVPANKKIDKIYERKEKSLRKKQFKENQKAVKKHTEKKQKKEYEADAVKRYIRYKTPRKVNLGIK